MRPWVILVVAGVVLAIGGFLALANPFAASIAVATLVGLFFLLGGIVQLWIAFSHRDDAHRLWNGFVGLMGVVAGVFLVANPLGGLVSLTVLLGVMLIVIGALRLAVAFRMRAAQGGTAYWLVLLSGAASLLLGILIFAFLPAAASTLLGLFLAFDLIAEGAALIALGLVARGSR